MNSLKAWLGIVAGVVILGGAMRFLETILAKPVL